MSREPEALKYYRKLVSLIYREIGSTQPENHRELYEKSKIGVSNLSATRKQDTKQFYHKSKSDNANRLPHLSSSAAPHHLLPWPGTSTVIVPRC